MTTFPRSYMLKKEARSYVLSPCWCPRWADNTPSWVYAYTARAYPQWLSGGSYPCSVLPMPAHDYTADLSDQCPF